MINYVNTNANYGEFIVSGNLKNRCKGSWKVDLTDEQIEKDIPPDYIQNKEIFKKLANKIIMEYNKENQDNIVKVHDVTKIGKWVKKNIKYDIRYSGRNNLTATDTLNNRVGVCDHIIKLYNALMYSLGYKVIYISGYVASKTNGFKLKDAHAWSLIKINENWLPFDATWGIFSGKLPVCHIFDAYFSQYTEVNGEERIVFSEPQVNGKFLN